MSNYTVVISFTETHHFTFNFSNADAAREFIHKLWEGYEPVKLGKHTVIYPQKVRWVHCKELLEEEENGMQECTL